MPISSSTLHVLVADDIASSRQHLCTLVSELGHQAHSVSSGRAAVEHVMSSNPDLVLLDLLMPDMDGFEVVQSLRSLVTQRWLPVIVTSSLEGDEHFIHALQRGADDYLTRPINPALLAAKLRHYQRVLGLQSGLAVLARRQRDIHDNIMDAVITLDGEGFMEESNLAAMRVFGDGQSLREGLNCESLLGAPLQALLAQREISLRKFDNSFFPAELAVSEWTDAGRVRYTIVVRDLTERRHIERMKDEFLATVSHELRTPLTSILGALSLLAFGAAGTLPASAVLLTEVAKRNGERLSHLIDDILDLTKLEGRQMVLHLQHNRLVPLLQEAITANQAYADRASIGLLLESSPLDPWVRVDADRFLQIMANLLSNAIKHSSASDTVRVHMVAAGSHVQVVVADQGPGIDPAFIGRIFEKFSQADSSDRRSLGGTGLGLYITRMLVERMGGQVTVASNAGAGASFIVTLPLFPPQQPLADSGDLP